MAFGFIDFAKEVLEASDRPLSVEEMWEAGCKRGLDGKLGSSGKTPVRTLSARIYVDLKNNPESDVYKRQQPEIRLKIWSHILSNWVLIKKL